MLRKINKFNFRFNFFALMVVNLYAVESIRQMPVRLGIFILFVLTVLFLFGVVISGFITKERFRRGVLVQAFYRSNYAIIGISVAAALVGDAGSQMASFLQLPTVLFYNFMGVLVLSVYSDYEAQFRYYGEGPLAEIRETTSGDADTMASGPGTSDTHAAKRSAKCENTAQKKSPGVDLGMIIKRIMTNPLIQGLMAGSVILLLREVIPHGANGELVFSLRGDLPWLYSAIQSLSKMATPLALVVLGGQLEMQEIGGYKKELAAGILLRLIIAPAIGFALLAAAIHTGFLSVGPVETAVLVAVFASPQAVSSIVMSTEMGGDGHLAGQIVVWSSIFGMVSLFFIILFLRMCGIL